MELDDIVCLDESQLERDIRSIINSSESSQSNPNIEKYVQYLWQKVTDSTDRIGGSTSNQTTTNSHPHISSSDTTIFNTSSFSLEPIESCESTQSHEASSPSILSNIGTLPQHTYESQPRKTRNSEECCKNQLITKKLSRLSYIEFNNQKSQYLMILKEICIRTPTNPMYYYVMDSSIHVKTNSMILQIQNIKNMQYVICEGYKNTLIFCDFV